MGEKNQIIIYYLSVNYIEWFQQKKIAIFKFWVSSVRPLLVQSVHTLGPGISNLQKVDSLVIRGNLLTKFVTLITNAGPRVLSKGPEERVIYLKILEMYTLHCLCMFLK